MLAACAGPPIPYSTTQVAYIWHAIGGALLALGVGLSVVLGFNIGTLGVLGLGAAVIASGLWR